jgi:hypothetical protein
MLSRTRIHRTPGETPRPAPLRPPEGHDADHARLRGAVVAKGMVLSALATCLMLFLLLNMDAVVEPNVRIPFLSFAAPGLLPVLLITAALSVACTLAARAVLNARGHLRDARRRRLTETVEQEASRIKHGGLPRRVTPQPVSA